MNVTAQEFATISMAIKAAYPSANLMPDKESKEVWYTMLADLDYSVCMVAIKEIISNSKFAPSIADIRQKCTGITNITVKNWSEAWESVLKAIRKYGYMCELEALESLDELTRKCVKRLGFQNICMSEYITADRANFRQIYEELASESRTDQQLQEPVLIKKQQIIAEHQVKPAAIPAKESRKEDQKAVAVSHDEIDRLLSDFRQSFK